MRYNLKNLLVATSLATTLMASSALAETELRMMWYNDGNEGEVMRSIIDRFEANNPDISVILDVVPINRLSNRYRFNWRLAQVRILLVLRIWAD